MSLKERMSLSHAEIKHIRQHVLPPRCRGGSSWKPDPHRCSSLQGSPAAEQIGPCKDSCCILMLEFCSSGFPADTGSSTSNPDIKKGFQAF